MERKENKPIANKPIREDDHIEQNDLPYDPNINKDDKQALQERGLDINLNDDRFLAERDRPVDFAADDLDIPGRNEADTTHEGTDIPDEENFQYDQSGLKKERSGLEDIPDEDAEPQ